MDHLPALLFFSLGNQEKYLKICCLLHSFVIALFEVLCPSQRRDSQENSHDQSLGMLRAQTGIELVTLDLQSDTLPTVLRSPVIYE